MKIKESYEFIYDKDGIQHKKTVDCPSDNVNIYDSWYAIERKKSNIPPSSSFTAISNLPKSVCFDLSDRSQFSRSYFKRIYPSVSITKSADKANIIICDDNTIGSYIKKYDYFEYYCHKEKLKDGIIQVDNMNGARLSGYAFKILEFVSKKSQVPKDKLVHINNFVDKFDGNRIKEMTSSDALNILKQVLSKSKPVKTLGAELVCGYIPKFAPITSFILSVGQGYSINRKLAYFINRYRRSVIEDVQSLDEWFHSIKSLGPIDQDVNKILNTLINSDQFKSRINYKSKYFSYSNNLQINGLNQQSTTIDEFKI